MKNCNCEEKLKEIKKLASEIRINTLKSLTHLGFGHYGGSLSVVEVLAVLYGGVMNINPEDPNWKGRDYFVLSKGHAGPALYATLALKGFFPVEEIYTLNQNGTNLPSHPDRLKTKGVDATTGSLGQGISIAKGIATALKMDKKSNRVFSIIGDGEINEGVIWETALNASKQKVDRLITILDWNGVQLDGTNDEIMPLGDVELKWKAFGYRVITVNGHDVEEISGAIESAKTIKGQPTIILAHTVKGKGVSFMEGNHAWHGAPIDDEHFEQAMKELEGNR